MTAGKCDYQQDLAFVSCIPSLYGAPHSPTADRLHQLCRAPVPEQPPRSPGCRALHREDAAWFRRVETVVPPFRTAHPRTLQRAPIEHHAQAPPTLPVRLVRSPVWESAVFNIGSGIQSPGPGRDALRLGGAEDGVLDRPQEIIASVIREPLPLTRHGHVAEGCEINGVREVQDQEGGLVRRATRRDVATA